MNDSFTDREDAPFAPKLWDLIDKVVQNTAREAGIGRRLLRVGAPLGVAARVGIGDDLPVGDGDEEAGPVGGQAAGHTHLHVPTSRTIPLLHQPFRLGLRSVQAFDQRGEPIDTRAIAEATRKLIASEDRLLFLGAASAGIQGVLTQPGALEIAPGDWSEPSRAADDVFAALSRLDAAERHGPYAIAVSPDRYYQLFRPYPGTSLTPYAQLSPMFDGGIVKAPGLHDSAVVIVQDESGPQLLLGSDLVASFDGREGVFYRFSLMESVAILPGTPGSVAVLRGAGLHARAPKPETQSPTH